MGLVVTGRAEYRRGHDRRHPSDITMFPLELGYRPGVPFAQGLADTFQGCPDDRARRKPLGARSAADG